MQNAQHWLLSHQEVGVKTSHSSVTGLKGQYTIIVNDGSWIKKGHKQTISSAKIKKALSWNENRSICRLTLRAG